MRLQLKIIFLLSVFTIALVVIWAPELADHTRSAFNRSHWQLPTQPPMPKQDQLPTLKEQLTDKHQDNAWLLEITETEHMDPKAWQAMLEQLRAQGYLLISRATKATEPKRLSVGPELKQEQLLALQTELQQRWGIDSTLKLFDSSGDQT